MKTRKKVLKPIALASLAFLWCAPTLNAQTAPTITNQPASQTVLAGSNVTLSVAVAGTGPFSYQWQFNGTNLPNSSIIITVAGNGSSGYSGDGGAATHASLSYPGGVTVDATGSFVIGDRDNNRVRKVDASGIIATIAGNGSQGYSGDEGLATNASLFGPTGVALDANGNLAIADTLNHSIRKVVHSVISGSLTAPICPMASSQLLRAMGSEQTEETADCPQTPACIFRRGSVSTPRAISTSLTTGTTGCARWAATA